MKGKVSGVPYEVDLPNKDEMIYSKIEGQLNEQIKEFAEQAGWMMDDEVEGFNTRLEKFAELIRADEREACAKLVEPNEEHRRDASWGYLGGAEGVELLDNIANAIRARGEK